jgi:hypothetical protein
VVITSIKPAARRQLLAVEGIYVEYLVHFLLKKIIEGDVRDALAGIGNPTPSQVEEAASAAVAKLPALLAILTAVLEQYAKVSERMRV